MTSFRERINNKCKECIYDPQAMGTWRKQVENCSSPNCQLYAVRPVPLTQNQAKLGEKPSKECLNVANSINHASQPFNKRNSSEKGGK